MSVFGIDISTKKIAIANISSDDYSVVELTSKSRSWERRLEQLYPQIFEYVEENITSDDLVDMCLDVLGPLDVLETTRNGLKKYASKYSHLSWADSADASNFDKSAITIIQLIVSSQEYQTI